MLNIQGLNLTVPVNNLATSVKEYKLINLLSISHAYVLNWSFG